jgi:hypothetical protein
MEELKIYEAGVTKHGIRIKIIFKGYIYSAWPESKNLTLRYFKRTIRFKEDGKWKSKKDSLHRNIYEHYHGIKLNKGDCVHHKNGNTLDNRFENLELINKSEHHFKHHLESLKKFVCSNCGKSFEGSAFSYNVEVKKTCSYKCYKENNKEAIKRQEKRYKEENREDIKKYMKQYNKKYYERKKQDLLKCS